MLQPLCESAELPGGSLVGNETAQMRSSFEVRKNRMELGHYSSKTMHSLLIFDLFLIWLKLY